MKQLIISMTAYRPVVIKEVRINADVKEILELIGIYDVITGKEIVTDRAQAIDNALYQLSIKISERTEELRTDEGRRKWNGAASVLTTLVHLCHTAKDGELSVTET